MLSMTSKPIEYFDLSSSFFIRFANYKKSWISKILTNSNRACTREIFIRHLILSLSVLYLSVPKWYGHVTEIVMIETDLYLCHLGLGNFHCRVWPSFYVI